MSSATGVPASGSTTSSATSGGAKLSGQSSGGTAASSREPTTSSAAVPSPEQTKKTTCTSPTSWVTTRGAWPHATSDSRNIATMSARANLVMSRLLAEVKAAKVGRLVRLLRRDCLGDY